MAEGVGEVEDGGMGIKRKSSTQTFEGSNKFIQMSKLNTQQEAE